MENIKNLKISSHFAPFKRTRGIEGKRDSLLTLNSQPSSHPYHHTSKRPAAFTMAEILITLTIIGIIAAITLPSLVGNIKEKSWASQRKALYSRMSQAVSMLPSLNGYGEYEGTWADDVVTVEKDTAATRFVTDGLSKVLQINNICSIDNGTSPENARKELKKCGIPEKISNMERSKSDFPTNLTELNPMFTSTYTLVENNVLRGIYKNPQHNISTNAAAFETKNGESIAVFYNPYCQPDMGETGGHYSHPKMCANFIYDLNGTKGPNQFGKDIGFITALYATDSEIVAPIPLEKDVLDGKSSQTIQQTTTSAMCHRQDKNSRVPSHEELLSLYYNINLTKLNIDTGYWSNTIYDHDSAWYLHSYNGVQTVVNRSGYARVRCVKKQ